MKKNFVIRKPWLTEKATDLTAKNAYVFLVDNDATKPEVKKAVKELYKVDVTGIRMVSLPGKPKHFRGTLRYTSPLKKAVVTVKSGQKIEILR